MSKKILKLSVLLIISSVFLSGCTLPWKKKAVDVNQDQSVNGQSANSSTTVFTKQLKKFLNDDELKVFLQTHNNLNNFSSNQTANLTSNSPLASYRADSDGASVPDIIKVSADYTYSMVRNELLIIKSRPASGSSYPFGRKLHPLEKRLPAPGRGSPMDAETSSYRWHAVSGRGER